MRRMTALVTTIVLIGGVGISSAPAVSASAPKAKKFSSCAELHKVYPYGVGKPKAKDKVRSGQKPVRNFTVNAKVYEANKKRLDRDKDGIACEAR